MVTIAMPELMTMESEICTRRPELVTLCVRLITRSVTPEGFCIDRATQNRQGASQTHDDDSIPYPTPNTR